MDELLRPISPYLVHDEDCWRSARPFDDKPCDCGLDAACAAVLRMAAPTVPAEPEAREPGICAHCGKRATCYGAYEGGPWEFACDDCCGHGNEDGRCVPVHVAAPTVPVGDEPVAWMVEALSRIGPPVWEMVGGRPQGSLEAATGLAEYHRNNGYEARVRELVYRSAPTTEEA